MNLIKIETKNRVCRYVINLYRFRNYNAKIWQIVLSNQVLWQLFL